MKRILINKIPSKEFEKSVACIGYFDGVHLGHVKLISRAIKDATKLGIKSSVICFEPDPINVICDKKNKHLTSYATRLMILEELGIDIVYVIKFSKEFMKLNANNFISKYLNKMNLTELICGYDYSFGYKARGNSELLNKKGNFNTIVIKESDYKGQKISSTRIKEAFIRGDFRLANRLLGYNYLVDLKVVSCLKQGKNWLVEAKLSDRNGILPSSGNYNGIIEIKGNKVLVLGKTKLEKDSHLYLGFDE